MKSTQHELSHIVYLLLLVITLFYPFIKSFEHRLRMYRKWKHIFPAVILTSLLFIIWDYWFVRQSVWHFNDHYILGVKLFQLPVEEWLFFIIIPYACFFIYEVTRYFFRLKRFKELFFGLHFILIIAFLFLGFWYQEYLYTFVCFITAACLMIIMGFIQFIKKRLPYFYVSWFLTLIPFLFINGVLTYLPVVVYNNEQITGMRLLSIPVEDVVYLLILMFINFSIYEILKSLYGRKITFKR